MEQSVALGIIYKLMNNKRCTAMELSNEFEISTRTVYRYIDTISASGIPLITFSGKNGGVELDENFKLDNNFITYDEVKYLLNIIKNDKNCVKNQILIEKLTNFLKKQ